MCGVPDFTPLVSANNLSQSNTPTTPSKGEVINPGK
jgi:hypothetical protein